MEQRKLAFIGAGNMTSAIISGLVSSGYDADKIIASNPSTPKLEKLQQQFGIQVTQDNIAAARQADVIVLAVKPQLMSVVCEQLTNAIDIQSKLFISIAAGILCERFEQMFGSPIKLVRTMPNTPSLLGKGMTGLYAPEKIAEQEKQFCSDMMSAVGETLWVSQESEIDLVIATAGSSPAYFFLFLEAMESHALALGMEKHSARLAVQQAMLGAAEMVCHNPSLEIATLRAHVTSKGGTTAKAIESFEEQGIRAMVSNAMDAAIHRAQQMAKDI